MEPAKNSAFSLIELMIVVAIVTLLAAVAIPTFTTYRLKAKQSEIRIIMNGIINGQKSFFIRPRLGADGRELEACYLHTGALPIVMPPANGAPLIPDGPFEPHWDLIGLPATEGTWIYHWYLPTGGVAPTPQNVPFCSTATGNPTLGPFEEAIIGDLDGDGEVSIFYQQFLVDDSGGPAVGPLIRFTQPNVY